MITFLKYYQKLNDEDKLDYKLRISQRIIRVVLQKKNQIILKKKLRIYIFKKSHR